MYLSSSMWTLFFFCLIRNKSAMQFSGDRDGLEHNRNGLPNIFPFDGCVCVPAQVLRFYGRYLFVMAVEIARNRQYKTIFNSIDKSSLIYQVHKRTQGHFQWMLIFFHFNWLLKRRWTRILPVLSAHNQAALWELARQPWGPNFINWRFALIGHYKR